MNSIKSIRFNDLGLDIDIKVAPHEVVHMGEVNLGHCVHVSEDDRLDIVVADSLPDLGKVVILIHEMMHAAEHVTGLGVPHSYIKAAAFGTAIALARSGALGATDEEIREFIVHAMEVDDAKSAAESDDDEEPIDAIEHAQRMSIVLAHFRECGGFKPAQAYLVRHLTGVDLVTSHPSDQEILNPARHNVGAIVYSLSELSLWEELPRMLEHGWTIEHLSLIDKAHRFVKDGRSLLELRDDEEE